MISGPGKPTEKPENRFFPRWMNKILSGWFSIVSICFFRLASLGSPQNEEIPAEVPAFFFTVNSLNGLRGCFWVDQGTSILFWGKNLDLSKKNLEISESSLGETSVSEKEARREEGTHQTDPPRIYRDGLRVFFSQIFLPFFFFVWGIRSRLSSLGVCDTSSAKKETKRISYG